MTIFYQGAVSSTFTPHTPSSIVPPPSISQPLPLSLVLSPETNYPPASPSLLPHNVKNYIHTQSNATTPHIHTLTLRTALLCPSKLVPLSLTRSASCIFQWWLLSLSSPLENKGFLCTQDRGREKDGELVSEEEILPSSVVDWAEKKKKSFY